MIKTKEKKKVGRMFRFLRFCAFLVILFFTGNVMAAGYTCSTTAYKKYTSCKAGYELTVNGVYNATPTVGNACTKCVNGGGGGTAKCNVVTTVTCAAGQYLDGTTCKDCASGYHCPSASVTYTPNSGIQGRLTCPAGYTKSASKATSESGCYLTTTAGKYIATAKSSEQTTCPAGSYCPSMNVYYGNSGANGGGLNACPAVDSTTIDPLDSGGDSAQWLKPACPAVNAANVTVSAVLNTWDSRKGKSRIEECAANYTITTPCGTIHKDSVTYNPGMNQYYMWGSGGEIGDRYYTSLKPGYYLTDQYSSTYCNTSTNRMLYKRAVACPGGGVYCPGFESGVPLCNSTEWTYSAAGIGLYGCETGTSNSSTGYWKTPTGATKRSQCYVDMILDKNGGSGAITGNANSNYPGTTNGVKTCYYGTDCELPNTYYLNNGVPTGLMQSGYRFVGGWGTDSSCMSDSTTINLTTSVSPADGGAAKVFACKTRAWNVTLNGNGATTSGQPVIYVAHGLGAYRDSGMFEEIGTDSNPITKPARSYKISYNTQGGNTVSDSTAAYSFEGYYSGDVQQITSDGYFANETVRTNLINAPTSSATYTAKWTPKSVTLPTPTRANSTFHAWNTKADASGVSVGSPYTPTTDITLYALWNCNTGYVPNADNTACMPGKYTITLDNANATTNGSSSIYFKKDTAIYLDSNATQVMTGTANPITIPKREYTLQFNVNGGNSLGSGSTVTSKYDFAGYYYNVNSDPTSSNARLILPTGYVDGGQIGYVTSTKNSNFAVYAAWTGGAVTLPSVSRAGYMFMGWYSDSALTNRVGDMYQSYTPTSNMTLYAKWSPVCNKITLNNIARGGTGGTTVVYKKTDSTKWYSDSDCSIEITAVTVPTKMNALYDGTYTTNAESGGVRCIDSYGNLSPSTACNVPVGQLSYALFARYECLYNYRDAGVNITGSCMPSKYTVTLGAPGATSAGTDKLYTVYNAGIYLDPERTQVAETLITPTWTYDVNFVDRETSMPVSGSVRFMGHYNWSKSGGGDSCLNSETYQASCVGAEQMTAPSQGVVYLTSAGREYALRATDLGWDQYNLWFAKWDTADSYVTAPVPTARDGYTFAGWNTKADGTGTSYAAGDKIYGTQSQTLYAKWTPKLLTITLNNAGATVYGASGVYFKPGLDMYLDSAATKVMTERTNPIAVPSRGYDVAYEANGGTVSVGSNNGWAGYTFGGYYTDNNIQIILPSGYVVNGQSDYITSTQTADLMLTAKWTGGSVTLPTPSRTGYTFAGWYSNSALTNKVGDAGASYTPGKVGVTLYAKWTPNLLTITLNNAGATTTGTTSIYYKPGLNMYLDTGATKVMTETANPISVPKRGYDVAYEANGGTVSVGSANGWAGYTFDGYYEGSYQIILPSGYVASGQSTYIPSRYAYDTTLTAKWTGGSVTLPAPSRTGYTFAGWYSDSALTNKVGDAGASYTPGKVGVTLYAKWTPNTYTVVYNLNGGEHDGQQSSPSSATYDVGFVVPNPIRTGYDFVGWKITGMDNTTHVYGDMTTTNSSIANTNVTNFKNLRATDGAVTFDAQWVAQEHTIDLRQDSGVYKTIYTRYDTGAYSDEARTKLMTTTTNPIDVPADMTYTVTFSSNGGTDVGNQISTSAFIGFVNNYGEVLLAPTGYITDAGIKAAKQRDGDTTYWYSHHGVYSAVTLPAPSRMGYTFAGWYSDSSLTNKVGDAGASYTPTSNVTLYAKWTPITYTVAYNANGGTGTMANGVHTYDVAKALTANAFTNGTKKFLGWSTNKNATTATYTNKQSVTNLTATNGSTVTLYAVWGTCTACAAGTGAECALSAPLGVCTYTTSCKTGYNTLVNDGKYNPSCTANTYTVAYNANGGTGTMASGTHTYNTAKVLSANAFTNGTKRFLGWSTSSTATTATYTNKQSVTNLTATNDATVTLYAVWGTCTACAAGTGAECTLSAPLGVCTYTTSCKPGYNTLVNDGKYNPSCTLSTYTIKYYDGPAEITGLTPVTYDVTTATFDLPIAYKSGSEFVGWYTDSALTSSVVTQIASGTTGDMVYYAKWSTCPAGSVCDGESVVLCPAGSYCAAGSSSAVVCAKGTYSTGGATTCTLADAGYYVDTEGAVEQIACPMGTYGSTKGLTSAECSGKCTAGYYGSATAQTVATCSGLCSAGYYCPEGSTSAKEYSCNTDMFCSEENPFWTSDPGATKKTSCYGTIHLAKQIMSGDVKWVKGLLTLPENSGCKSLESSADSHIDKLQIWYGTKCMLPTNILTGYVHNTHIKTTGKWATNGNRDSNSGIDSITQTHCGLNLVDYMEPKKLFSCDPGYHYTYVQDRTFESVCVKCESPYYCPGVKDNPYLFGEEGLYECSALDSTKTDGVYSSVAPFDSSKTCRFTQEQQAVPQYCETKISNTVSYTGTEWEDNTYSVTAKSGAFVFENNTVGATCDLCRAGTYCANGEAAVCGNNQYSDEGASACEPCATDSGYGNSGSSAADHAGVSSCKVTCDAGQYVENAGAGCVDVTANYWGAGGIVAQNATLNRTACPTGLTTCGSGLCANEAEDCGRKLHAGDKIIHLRSAKRTKPALHVMYGDQKFYGNLVAPRSGTLKVANGGITYSVVSDEQ